MKGDWNFDGFIVSDWGSIDQMIPHGFARDGEHAAELAVIAGSDMDMESSLYVSKLVGLVESGKVKEELLDDAVRRILRVKYELGLIVSGFTKALISIVFLVIYINLLLNNFGKLF